MNNGKKLKILLATGIYPPDLGGPATFARIMSDELPKAGCETEVLTYGRKEEKGYGPGVTAVSRTGSVLCRYFGYFRKAWQISRASDVIYIFDLMAAGLPCALVKIFRPRVKLVVRLGGDYQWEKAVQRGWCDSTLADYLHDQKFNPIETIIYRLSGIVLNRCDRIIFNAHILRDIYVNERGIDERKTVVIKNVKPAPPAGIIQKTGDGTIRLLYIGRLVAFKNIIRSLEAFEALSASRPEKIVYEIIGEGPEKTKIAAYIRDHGLGEAVRLGGRLDHKDALEKIAACDIMILPSLTEVNAHITSEARAFSKIIVLSAVSESHFIGERSPAILYVDPLSVDSIRHNISRAIDTLLVSGYDCPGNGTLGDIAWELERVISEHKRIFMDVCNTAKN